MLKFSLLLKFAVLLFLVGAGNTSEYEYEYESSSDMMSSDMMSSDMMSSEYEYEYESSSDMMSSDMMSSDMMSSAMASSSGSASEYEYEYESSSAMGAMSSESMSSSMSGSMSSESMSMSESTSMGSMSSGSMSSESMSMSESTSSSSSTDSSESSSSSSMTSSSSSEETAEDSTEVSSSSSETMSSSMSDSMSSGSMTMSSDVASAPVGSESNIETGESSDEEMVSSGALPAFTIVCPADVSVTTTCGGQVAEVSVPGATSNDPNVQITNSKYPQFDTTLNNLSGNYPLGTHTVGYTGHAEGLGQASCTFTITISAGECTETPVTSTPCFVGETACCSDQGVWESDNTCTCDEGFVGDACMGMATASMQINLDGPVDTDAFINAIADALDIDASRVQVVSSGDDQITLAIESDGAEEGSTAIEELGDALEGGNDAFADFGVTGFNTFSATGEPETTVNYTASTPRGTLSVPWWVFVAIGVVVIIAIVIIVVVVKRGSRGKAIKKNSNFGDDMKMQLEHAYDDEEDFHPI